MKRRSPELVRADVDGIPLVLVAGRCIEVWGGPHRDAYIARREWTAARDRYLRVTGMDVLRPCDRPHALRDHAVWSYDFLASTRPDYLPQKLADRGLPAGWTPTPATRDDLALTDRTHDRRT